MKLLIFSCLFFSSSAFSHSGGTDAYGCHYNRTTGVYHCHRSAGKERGPASVDDKKKPIKNKKDSAKAKKKAPRTSEGAQ